MLTLMLRPEQEAKVRERARVLGMAVDSYLEPVVERELSPLRERRPISEAEIKGFFDELRQLSSPVRDFPDPNFGRATFYKDHD